MIEIVQMFDRDMIERLSGPMHAGILIQSTMAFLLALKDGLRDAREDRPAFLVLAARH